MFILKQIFSLFFSSPIIGALKWAYGRKLQAATDDKKLATEVTIKRLETTSASIKAWAATTKEGLGAGVFWFAWGLFAISLGTWWVLVMIDTMIPSIRLGIPDLPKSIKPWAEIVFSSIFYSGATVGSVQVGGKVLTKALDAWGRR